MGKYRGSTLLTGKIQEHGWKSAFAAKIRGLTETLLVFAANVIKRIKFGKPIPPRDLTQPDLYDSDTSVASKGTGEVLLSNAIGVTMLNAHNSIGPAHVKTMPKKEVARNIFVPINSPLKGRTVEELVSHYGVTLKLFEEKADRLIEGIPLFVEGPTN